MRMPAQPSPDAARFRGNAEALSLSGPAFRSQSSVNPPDGLIALLRQPSLCFLATVMPDGSPQVTQTWVDTDGEHVVINSVRGHQKVKNIERDPRVAVNVCDVSSPSRYYAIRGRVIGITAEGGAEHRGARVVLGSRGEGELAATADAIAPSPRCAPNSSPPRATPASSRR